MQRATRRAYAKQVLLVGSGPLAARVRQELGADPHHISEIIGYVDSEPQSNLHAVGVAYLGGIDDLEAILMHLVVDEVFVGLPIKSGYEQIQRTFAACERVGVPARYPTDLFRTTLAPPRLEQRVNTPLIAVTVAADDYRLVIKRAMDVLGAGLLLVACAPVLLLVAAAIKLTSPGPVLFAHERYGYMKRRFRMYKFRTMVSGAEEHQAELENRNEASGPIFKIRADPRVTPVGRFLRRTSLDELPQLWHVLIGQMSLVGPRPMSLRDVSRFQDPWLMRRFSVRPGLTCLWQISGRSNLGFDKWVELDLTYIDGWSLRLDCQIIVKTIPAVVKGTGAH
jgi:exopolysaccharide biosynthesis polyprenyl glycosylphosphotransferase